MATVVPNGTVHLDLTTNDIFAAVQLGIITQEEARIKLGFKPTIEKEGK